MPEVPKQQTLFVVAEQTDQLATPDLFVVEAAIPIVERNIHLQNAITYLAAVSTRTGFIEHDNRAISQNRQHAPASMRRGVEANRAKFARAAEDAFLKATANETLVATGLAEERGLNIKSMGDKMFSDFMTFYYGARHYSSAQAFRRGLAQNNLVLTDGQYRKVQSYGRRLAERTQFISEETVTRANRAQGLRPHAPKAAERGQSKGEDSKPLDTRGRLRAILEDSRAGFTPTTNREKNEVLAFLDYLDNPKYPLGANNRLIGIYNRAEWIHNRKNSATNSERPVESFVYEFGDFLRSSTGQLKQLEELSKDLMQLPNRRVSLSEEHEWIDLNHPGLNVLVRYRDLMNYMNGQKVGLPTDPLRTAHYRWTKDVNEEGPHKLMEDQYTAMASQVSPGVKEYVKEQGSSMSVGEAQDLLVRAMVDQSRRQAFMRRRLEEVVNLPMLLERANSIIIIKAREAARQILDELQLTVA